MQIEKELSVKYETQIKELEQMYAHMLETLIKIEYLDPQNPDHLLKSYRKISSGDVIFGQNIIPLNTGRLI